MYLEYELYVHIWEILMELCLFYGLRLFIVFVAAVIACYWKAIESIEFEISIALFASEEVFVCLLITKRLFHHSCCSAPHRQ